MSLESSQSCRSVDADAWGKWILVVSDYQSNLERFGAKGKGVHDYNFIGRPILGRMFIAGSPKHVGF